MFPIIAVPDQAANLYEQLGTKPKFWFSDEQSVDCLFKEVQNDTGEDWSEKVASELCELLGLEHAQYDLAVWRGKRGVVSPTFVRVGGRLVLGNELLTRIDSSYPKERFFRVSQHTLERVLAVIRDPSINLPMGMNSFPGVETAVDVFLGYLMLDAWIANQDRHHENWAVIVSPKGTIHLAPTYDHASSLGRNETDENRKDRLTTRDRGRSMERYVERARSAFFATSSTKPLSTLDAFRDVARGRPAAAQAWLGRLKQVKLRDTRSLLESVPSDRISGAGIDFARKMLELNYHRLLALQEV